MLWRAGMALVPADIVAVGVAAALAYLANRVVSFERDPFVRWVHQPSAFLAVAALAGLVDVAVLASTFDLGAPLLAAKLLAVAAAAVVRLLAYRWVLLRGVRRRQERRSERPTPPGELRFSVVVPAYAEEGRIADTIARLAQALAGVGRDGGVELVVVDDGSPDGTAAAARDAAARLAAGRLTGGAGPVGPAPGVEVVVVVQTPNRGKGAAVRAGMLAARGRTVAFTDADLAYSPDQLLGVLAAIESGWDVVVGSRHHRETSTVAPPRRLRELGSRVVNTFTLALLLGQYRDTQCGLKGFRSDVARVLFGQSRIDGFAFDVELFHLAERYELSLVEVPVRVQNSERSTVRVARDAARLVVDLFRIRGYAKRGLYDDLAAEQLLAGREPSEARR